jgi:hypothetical protein
MMLFLCVLAPCILVRGCQRYRETYCLHPQGRFVDFGKCRVLYTLELEDSEDVGGRGGPSNFLCFRNTQIIITVEHFTSPFQTQPSFLSRPTILGFFTLFMYS